MHSRSIALTTLTGCPASGTGTGSEGSTGSTDPSTSGPATGAPTTTTGPATGGEESTTTASPTTGAVTTGAEPGTTGTTGAATTTGGAETTGGAWAPKGCPDIYSHDLLPTFALEIAPTELAEIQQEWLAADESAVQEHPLVSFTYEDTVITNASVRLRGNSSHWADQKKMQFEVSFNTYDPKGRFEGLKHLLFDAADWNRSFLRDRLALQILRDVGIAAPCANNARVVLNGEYYGLFTSIEKVDSEFLERNFEDPNGNLYKRAGTPLGWRKKTNEDDPDTSDVKALGAAKTVDALLAVMNLEQALLEWATEAVIPNRDGAWGGGLNFYVYNDPKTGFVVIPWDLDDSFTRLPFDTDPIVYRKEMDWGRPFYDLALADPVWFHKYIAAIDRALHTGYDPATLQARIDAWGEQIASAAADDVNKPFTTAQHFQQVKDMRRLVADRAKFLEKWLACWQGGGVDENGDGLCDGA